MKVFVAKKSINLFGKINVKKNDKLIVDSDFNIKHNGVLYRSPINQIGLELAEIFFCNQETRNYKLELIGI